MAPTRQAVHAIMSHRRAAHLARWADRPAPYRSSGRRPVRLLIRLSPDERAALAGELIESLDAEVDPDAEAAWSAEDRARLQRVDAGEAQPVPWAEARPGRWAEKRIALTAETPWAK